MNSTGTVDIGGVTMVSAVFISVTTVKCQISSVSNTNSYYVSVSNNALDVSTSLLVIVANLDCQACDLHSGSCSEKVNYVYNLSLHIIIN